MVNNNWRSGLSDEELRYEKIVDEIKNETSTLKCIGILRKKLSENINTNEGCNSKYRITELKYKNHTEYWCEKSVRLFGVHIFWDKTTSSYHSTFEFAKRHLEDRINRIVQIIHNG